MHAKHADVLAVVVRPPTKRSIPRRGLPKSTAGKSTRSVAFETIGESLPMSATECLGLRLNQKPVFDQQIHAEFANQRIIKLIRDRPDIGTHFMHNTFFIDFSGIQPRAY